LAGVAEPFDVAVVGGGVVGCAVARRFVLEGARTVLIERHSDFLSGASKANSALLHTGFDAPPRSLELACLQAGRAEFLAIRERLNLPLLETGALMVAWTETEQARLPQIVAQAHANGVGDVQPLDAAEVYRREPGLAKGALGGLLVPGEHVVDPWSMPLAYLRQAVENGAEVRFDAPLEQGGFDGETWSLELPQEMLRAKTVVNCAGLYGDRLDEALLGDSIFRIRPRKGQFLVYDKAAHELINAIILPVPDAHSKGIVVARTIFGNLLVGPTAEDQESRSDSSVTTVTLERLKECGVRILPELATVPVTAVYAGLRPASEVKDYCITSRVERRWITVGAIRSTGLTAALGIAAHVLKLYCAIGEAHRAPAETVWPAVPNLAEHAARDWHQPGYGRIVCHCEMVTEREIRAALAGPLGARDLGGLRRRTRAMLGRCQGFYCAAEVAALADPCVRNALTIGAAHG